MASISRCLRLRTVYYQGLRSIHHSASPLVRNQYFQSSLYLVRKLQQRNVILNITRQCNIQVPVNGSVSDVGKIEVKINLMYTCKACGGHNSHLISRQAYEHGVVIVTCESCNNRHLIADNLNWFEDIKEKNIEEILAKKGEVVLKVKAVPDTSKEYSE